MVRKGQRYRAKTDLPVTVMTLWRAPYTGGHKHTLPAGEEFVIATDPPPSATAVYALPVNYRKLHAQFVPWSDRKRFLLYAGYYVCVDLKRVATDSDLVENEFKPGFRLSAVDVVILVIGFVAAAFSGFVIPALGVAIAFVVAHFFLFCNVVRMDRPLELVWAALFAALAALTILTNYPGWPASFAAALIATVTLVTVQARQPSYHGVFWQRINPELPNWWEAKKLGK